MAVGVDELFQAKGRWWCHLLCDDFSEAGLEHLHEFARKLGVPERAWHNPEGHPRPHYDLTPAFREVALQNGAIPLSRREVVAFLKRGRAHAKGHRVGPQTERLELRAMTASDAEAFFALNSDPVVMRYTGEPSLDSLEQARVAIANYPDFETVGFGRWGCVLKQSQEMVGFCGLKYLPELDVVDVGYRFLPHYWGRGLATESCLASLKYGFEILNLERVVGLVEKENLASIRVLEKVGMKADGTVLYEGQEVLQFSLSREA